MNGESRAHGPASTPADDQNTVPRPGMTKLHHTPWEINLDSCPRDIACQFAEAGYQIFPLKPNSKAPATENGFHDAQHRVESVAAQFDNLGLSQTGNIGIAVPDDDFVLDFDPRNGGTNSVVAEMIAAGKIPVTPDGTPDTVVFTTGGGGHHFWFKLPQGIDSNRLRGKLRPGVDVKIGGKGYIVAPGSRHPNGGRYGILCGDSIDDIAEAPPALMEELLKPEPKKPAGQPITATATSDSRAWASATIETRLEEMRTCPEGGRGTRFNGRDDACFQTAMRMAELSKGGHITELEARQLVMAAALQTGLSESVIERKLDRAFAHAEPDYGPPPANQADTTLTDENGNPFMDTTHQNNVDPGDDTIRVVPWPVLSPRALHGVAGELVNDVAPHTEADPAALLVQFLAVFGAIVGRATHIRVGNEEHPAIIHPLIVGRTSSGAKGTSTGVVKAIVRIVAPEFLTTNTVSGLSSDAGLIECVSDPVSDLGKDGNEIVVNPGVLDKRLLVIESEYGSVLARGRRENNPLPQVIRQAWDGDDLRTLNRKSNALKATRPHVVIVGHITPGEFKSALRATDFSGGSVNRLLICMSRRSRLHTRFGNVPDAVLQAAAAKFTNALSDAEGRDVLTLTNRFWERWDQVYAELVRDRPDSAAAAASSRAVPTVLRLAMIYALMDGDDQIDTEHLDAALALWEYCEHSIRWLFSTHELEEKRAAGDDLANFILGGGSNGRTRTEISADLYQRHKPSAEISAELAPLIHDGIVLEKQVRVDGNRPTTRYIHRSMR